MGMLGIGREPNPAMDFLSGGGQMRARIRTFDWSQTHLGPIEDWSESLRASVSACLSFPFAMAVAWGPDLLLLYNDACIRILGTRHPHALGKPYRECFAGLNAEMRARLILMLERSDQLIREGTLQESEERYRA